MNKQRIALLFDNEIKKGKEEQKQLIESIESHARFQAMPDYLKEPCKSYYFKSMPGAKVPYLSGIHNLIRDVKKHCHKLE